MVKKLTINPHGEHRSEVREALEELRSMEAAGEVVGLAIVVVNPDGQTSHIRTGGGSDKEIIGALFLSMLQIGTHGWSEV